VQTRLPATQTAVAESRGVSTRAIVLALLLVALAAPAAFYAEILFATTYMFASGVPAMAPLALLLLMTILNPLASRLRLTPLSRGELLSIYAIVLVGAPLVTHGILIWMLATCVSILYGTQTSPEWDRFLIYMPTWFSPTEAATVMAFFKGEATVPWSQWLHPVLAWGSFMVALFFASLCLVLLFRRQWITHERLSFPFAQVPLELVRETDEGIRGQRSVNWYLWAGLLVGFGIMTLTRLSELFPALPSFSLTGQTLIQWQSIGPLAGLGAWDLWLPPGLIGIAYLIPKDLSFSCCFFWVVRLALTVIAIAAGGTAERPEEWWDSSFPAPTYQGGGAVLAVTVWMIWIGRRHLGRVLRSALAGRAESEFRAEYLTYRLAIIGFILCTAYLVAFYVAAGARVSVGAVIVALILVHYMVWTRLRADTGLGFIPFPLIVNSMMVVPFGAGILRPREAIALLASRWSYFPGFGESFEVCTGSSLEAFKIADAVGLSSRRLLLGITAGFLVSVVVGIYVVLTGEYHYGFLNTPGAWAGWVNAMLRRNGSQAFEYIFDPKGPDVNGMIGIGAGATATLLLGFMRARFWWWPLHPIGYLAANCWGMHWFSQPFFVGWAFKWLVVRYGGLGLYRKTVPLAIGLILGDVASQACWVTLLSTLRALRVPV